MVDLIVQALTSDEEIAGRITLQAQSLLHQLNFGDRTKPFFDHLLDTSTKLHALKYHQDNYRRMEVEHIEKVKASYHEEPRRVLSAHELLFELEAFLLQTKSALDIAVKVFGDLFPDRFRVHSFGDRGEHLLKGLRAFARDKNAKQPSIERICALIQADQTEWLKEVIEMRDTISHYRTFTSYCYRVREDGGQMQIVKPAIGTRTTLEFLEVVYRNCLEFLQDLICLALELWLPPSINLQPIRTASDTGIEKYLKYTLGIRLAEESDD